MTTIAAIVYPKLKLAAIGADGQVTLGEQIAKVTAKKFTVLENMGFAFAGSAMAGMAAARLFRDCIETDPDPETVLMKFQDAIERFDDPVLTKGAVGIAAWPEGLYYIATTDCPMRVDRDVEGAFIAASGSGGPYALGALHALAMQMGGRTDIDATLLKKMVERAIEVGIHHDRNSGGVPTVEVLDGNQPQP